MGQVSKANQSTLDIAQGSVELTQLENVTDGKIIVGNGSNVPTAVTMSSDTTIINTGATTIEAKKITTAKIADAAVTQAQTKIKTVVALTDADATLTAAQMIDSGIFTITPTVARALTTDTAANLVAALPNYQVGTWFDIIIVNTAAFNVTLTAGVGITLSGGAIIHKESATWRARIDSATAVTIYNTAINVPAAGVAAFLATPSSANLITAMTDESGTGALVFATSPTLVTPALGTPASGVATNITGLPTAGLVDGAVTYAKIQNVSATDKLLGRVTAGAGVTEEIACTAAGRAILDDADNVAQLVTLGVTATAAELNTLDGILPTVTELNYVDGVTSAIQGQIDTKAPTASPTFTGTVVIPTPFTLGAVSVLPTGTELNYVDGVTSAIQTQINTKAPLAGPTFTGLVKKSTTAAITAFAGGGQASAVELVSDINEVSVCASAADSVKLPGGIAGMEIMVVNRGIAAMNLFPASGDYINEGAVDTAVSIAIDATAIAYCYIADNWEVIEAVRA